MGLRGFIARRIVYSVILVFAVIVVDFLLFMAMPGNPIQFLMGEGISRESGAQRIQHEQQLAAQWGIGQPLYIQLFRYMSNLLTWNFGKEIASGLPISSVLSVKIPYTLMLLGTSTVLSIIIGIWLGMVVIQRRGTAVDTGSVVGALVAGSLPTFWIGLVLLWIFSNSLGWFPGAQAYPTIWDVPGGWPQAVVTTTGYSTASLNMVFSISSAQSWNLFYGYISHLILPLATLTLFNFGGMLLLTRATMLDAITEDYIVTARAKGLTERSVLYKHALKNASLPIITAVALSFGFVLSGAIITETVFSYPGLGAWIYGALQIRDYTVLMAFFYIISLCVIVANIVSDLLYGVIDPRIKYG
ncbi:MAG: ABC transporter permease [Candidatus Bathyarchaeia archaeon]|jgi:peptide/nickel transport system permease protein